MRVATAGQIDAPPERVCPLLDEDENLKLWIPDVIATTHPNVKRVGDSIRI
jgi:uncharacterized protein YndB with AHSA1/START domain